MGGEARPSEPSGADPFTSPPAARSTTPPPLAPKPPPQPPAIYHPVPPRDPSEMDGIPPMSPPSLASRTGTERNWMAIVALVLGFFGGGIFGFALGIAALRAVQAGRASNRAVAIWAIVVNALVGILYFALFGALNIWVASLDSTGGVTGEDAIGREDRYMDDPVSNVVPVTEIPYGTCFLEPEPEDGYFYGVVVVDCSEPHDAQVYAAGRLAEQEYISEDRMGEIAVDLCFTDEALASVKPDAEDLFGDAYFPGLESWNEGDRGYVCFVWQEEGPLTGSVLVDASETFGG